MDQAVHGTAPQQPHDEPRGVVLTTQGVAERFVVSRRTVSRHCAQGRLPADKRDGRWQIGADAAAAWAQREALAEVRGPVDADPDVARLELAADSDVARLDALDAVDARLDLAAVDADAAVARLELDSVSEVARHELDAADAHPDVARLDALDARLVVDDVPWLVVREGERLWVGLRALCDALGLDEAAEATSLGGRPWAQLRRHAGDAVVLERRTLSMWLATIEPTRVAPAARTRLERYQRECDALLDGWLLGGADAANDDLEPVPAPSALATLAELVERQAERLASLERWIAERDAERDAALEPIEDNPSDPAPVQQWRSRVNRALQGYCQLSQVSHRLAWREAYVRLYYHCGIDAARRQRVRATTTTIEVLTEQELRWLHAIIVQMSREWQHGSLRSQA